MDKFIPQFSAGLRSYFPYLNTDGIFQIFHIVKTVFLYVTMFLYILDFQISQQELNSYVLASISDTNRFLKTVLS